MNGIFYKGKSYFIIKESDGFSIYQDRFTFAYGFDTAEEAREYLVRQLNAHEKNFGGINAVTIK
jgi:hypothetical protein